MRWLPFLFLAGVAAAQPRRPVVKTGANDDLPHHAAKFGPLFDGAKDCIPKSDEVTVALDAYDGKLVACAQVMTRQGASVFLDNVSFACWNVDPNGKLSRRADLGRSYFECQDGCPTEVGYRNGAIAYDGKKLSLASEDAVTIYERKPDGTKGAVVTTIKPVPDAFSPDVAYVGGMFLGDGHVFDETGTELATLPIGDVRVLDDAHVIVVDGKRGTLFDLTTKKAQTIKLDKPYTSGPVAFGGKAFAIAGRQLVVLDAKLKSKRTINLPACRARSD